MKKQLALLALGLVVVLVLSGQVARAATRHPVQPNDSNPWWSWDARELGFQREQRGLDDVHVVPAGHGGAGWIAPGVPRGWRPGGGGLLVDLGHGEGTGIFAADGTPIGGFAGTDATWSPDGGRIAYLRDDVLYVANAVGRDERALDGVKRPSWDVAGPAWSPDGTQIAIATVQGLAVLRADGSGGRPIFSGANQSVNPSWSPDGATIAFERNDGPHWVIWLVGADGTNPRPLTSGAYNSRYPQWAPVGERLAFISDRQHMPGGATQYQFALYVQAPARGAPTKLLDDVHPYTPPRWSPTAAQLAVAAGQECRRFGIYVVASEGRRGRRRSNLCRFEGTPRGDVLRGTAYPDFIESFAGNDRIEARDGSRDVIDCGAGVDTALVDRLDVVAHCEHVLRP